MEEKLDWLGEGQSEVEGAEAEGGELSVSVDKVNIFYAFFSDVMLTLIFSSGVSGRRGGRFSAQGMG